MNIFQRIFRKAAASVQQFLFAPRWTRYAFTQYDAYTAIEKGYKANSAVSACATTLQLTFPEPPFLTGYDKDGRFVPDYKHPMLSLLKQPNPDMGMAEFLQFAIAYCPIGGNAYFWKQRAKNRKVIALWPFSDLQMTPIAGHDTSEGFVSHYEYNAGDGNFIEIPKSEVIHWKWMIDPQNPWQGIGAIALCAREIDRDSEATAYIYALLKNNAVPPVVITLEPGDDPTQEELDTMGKKWIAKHSSGQPAFITNGMKAEAMGYDLNKLAAESLGDIPETRIAANFHVPPSVAGLNVGVKRSDYGDTAARKAYTEQTLMALWRSLASELLNGLKEEYPGTPDNFTLRFDLRNVGALQEQKKDQWSRITDSWTRGLLTRTEAKQELGLMPQPGDDVYFVSLASEFIPVGEQVIRDQGTGNQEPVNQATGKQMKSRTGGRVLQRIRVNVSRRMESAVDGYFSKLAEDVTARVGKNLPPRPPSPALPPNGRAHSGEGSSGEENAKELPNADDLITGEDQAALTKLIKRFYLEIIQLSWNTWNASLGVETAFDLTDPVVTKILRTAEMQAETINGYTSEKINEVLAYASENGWSIDQIVRGDPENGIPGLRDVIDETYKNRARTIARSELGQAQNSATAMRYENAGVDLVEILDNGDTDDDEECKIANGQIWSMSYFTDHLLEHPNCTRAAAPYFGNAEPDRS